MVLGMFGGGREHALPFPTLVVAIGVGFGSWGCWMEVGLQSRPFLGLVRFRGLRGGGGSGDVFVVG